MSNVLIVEDDPVLREAISETIESAGFSYLSAKDGREALMLLERHQPMVVLSDIRMDKMDGQQLLAEIQRRTPELPVILMTAHGCVEDAVYAMRKGAVDYLQKPFSAQALTTTLARYIRPSQTQNLDPIANDAKSKALFAMAYRAAQSDVSVMITGESGTGKEVLAHYIHNNSPRAKQPFIAINCAAIPEQMLEATLFGYEKGSFTGAYKTTQGKFEQAQGGTILLDEVSEMSLPLQAKLLRVLQEKEVERVGGSNVIALDVRVLATSNRHLMDEVALGRFREDLFYRLNVFPLHWAPLRERCDDILPLARYLIVKHCRRVDALPILSTEAEYALVSYEWPGNARELDNVIQRAMVLQTEGVIQPEHLQLAMMPKSAHKGVDAVENKQDTLQTQEYTAIEKTLNETNGNRQAVANKLGISERTLRYKLAKMRENGYVV